MPGTIHKQFGSRRDFELLFDALPSHEWLGYFRGCDCGTAVHAAQKLNRHWMGMDITPLAISHIEKRLKDAFGSTRVPRVESGVAPDSSKTPIEKSAEQIFRRDAENRPRDACAPQSRLEYQFHGTPKDLAAARDLANPAFTFIAYAARLSRVKSIEPVAA